MWRAQSEGVLARDQLAGRELTQEARATLSLLQAKKLMNQFGAALQRASGKTARQPISVVLLGPLLWSRFEPRSSEVHTQFHVDGPQPGDAVIVTELATVEALLDGKLKLSDAMALGVLKIYAPAATTTSAQNWLAALKTS